MSRRRTSPLKPLLNQIRAWAQQGRTDAWIGHQLDVSPSAIAEFRSEQGIVRARPSATELGEHQGEATVARPDTHGPVSLDSVADLLDAELAARPPRRDTPAPVEPAAAEPAEPKRRRRRSTKAAAADEAAPAEAETEAAAEAPPAAEAESAEAPDGTKRRRRRRSGRTAGEGEAAVETPETAPAPAAPEPAPPVEAPAEAPAPRRRRRTAAEREAAAAVSPDASRVDGRLTRTLQLELDASLLDDPVFREHWLAVRDVVAEVRAGEIVLRPR